MKHKYLVAVSGGPDSMALLDITRRKDNVEVAHVNYHKRDTAKRDEKIVRSYCKKYNIKFHKLDVRPEEVKGNFQAYARKARYEFFAKLCNLNNLEAVLVAHHKDDLIETYLMQVEKKIGVNHYGLSSETYLYGVKVIRPLLDYRKKELIKYCDDNNIEYGIDESNLTDTYKRNKIRHEKVEKYSDAKIDKIIKQINSKNNAKLKQLEKITKYLHPDGKYTVKEFLKIPYIKTYLRLFFENKSDKYLDEMLRQLSTCKSCKYVDRVFYIVKEYDLIHCFMNTGEYEYKFNNIKELEKFNTEYFKIRKKGTSFEGVTVNKSDFPIKIRSPKKDDSISMLYGTKKLNRYFIDNKVYLQDRLTWPVVENNKKEIILVPGIGCNKSHYSKKHSFYVIKNI